MLSNKFELALLTTLNEVEKETENIGRSSIN